MKKITFFLITFVLCGLMTNAQVNLQNGLIAHYPFNGNASDESGNSLNGTIIGAIPTSDRFESVNSAYDFDYANAVFGEQNDEIYIPYNSLLNVNNITVSVWIYPRAYYWTGDAGNKKTTIINRFQYGYATPNGQAWGIQFGETWVRGYIVSPNGATANYAMYNNPIALNQWHNIILSYDGTNIKLYINGVLGATLSYSGGMNILGNSGISIGESNQANGYWTHTNGKIDDIRIYNRAINEQEIQALYNEGNSETISTINQNATVGNILTIPINTSELTALDNVIAYQFDFNYDNTKLEYIGSTIESTLSEGGTLQVNPTTNKLSIAWARGTALIGTGEILKLQFNVLAIGETTPTITNALYNSESVNATNGTITVIYKYGDIDGNDFVQAYDAALAIQYSVGLDPIPLIDPIPWENWRIIVANVDGIAGVTANDASEILKYTVGLITSFPVESGKKSDKSETADVNITLINNELVFQSSGNLFGLNVNVNENINVLGQPEFLNTNMLNATNINATTYSVGLATAISPSEGETFMKIPVTTTENVNITFDMFVNTEVKSVTVDVTTGIVTINEKSISVFPNPTNNILNFSNVRENTKITIYDISGRLLTETLIINNQVNVSNLSNGIYTLKINNNNEITTINFVKQ